MALLQTKEGREIIKRVSLKNVKLGIGHDLSGMYADFYLNGKKMGYFNDDGWGGETEIVYVNDLAKQDFESFLIVNDVAEIMFANGWDFLKEVGKINLHNQAEEVINAAVNMIEEKKAEKKVQKACLKGIYYKSGTTYKGVVFKLPIKDMVKAYGEKGKEFLQQSYNKVKSELKKGEEIVNTNLEELGIKL